MKLQSWTSLTHNKELLWRLCEREIISRYRGSVLGWGWTLIQPLLMLAVYTFVFSTVFKARWPDLQEAGPLGFAINLFTGLIVFNLASECIGKSSTLITSQPNYVKKVIFPLELLSVSAVGTAFFHALTSLAVLAVFKLIATGGIPLTSICLPLVWLPLIAGCTGISWILSATGVYIRDLSQLVNVLLSVLMFMSAVFYPISALPDQWQPILLLNPLVHVIEATRAILLQGKLPEISYLAMGIPLTLLFCEFSYRLFRKARRVFADVI